MQQWEYMVVRSYGGVVMLINGQETAQMAGAQPVGQMLYEFLSERGAESWEVVGMAGVRDGMEIILKRVFVLEDNDEMEEEQTEA
jgi:hypothetical protein